MTLSRDVLLSRCQLQQQQSESNASAGETVNGRAGRMPMSRDWHDVNYNSSRASLMLMLERRSSSRASQCQCFVSCSSGCTTQRQARLIVCRQLLLQTTFHSGGKLALSTRASQMVEIDSGRASQMPSRCGGTMAERVKCQCRGDSTQSKVYSMR